MKTNIFSIPPKNVEAMREKFSSVALKPIHEGSDGGWSTAFYFSAAEEPRQIAWVKTFRDFFGGEMPRNLTHFAAYTFAKEGHCYVLTFGKSHFYVRQFCDHDFGIEMAKRLADESEIRMTAAKKFAGKRKKEINSFGSKTPLIIESGESIDFIRALVNTESRETFGKTAKFGSSLLINPPIDRSGIGKLLDSVVEVMKRAPIFALPRTMRVADDREIEEYDALLLKAIQSDGDEAEFVHASHDLVGVDFVFSGDDRYDLVCSGYEKLELGDAELDLAALRGYIKAEGVRSSDIFNIKVRVENDGQSSYTRKLKESLDFVIDGENVMLSQGHWLRFNDDYLDQLHTAIDGIAVEDTEPEFEVIDGGEPAFNKELGGHGYVYADTDFSKIKTAASTPIEAWDLQKGPTVYAVKFGTAQKVGYVCDQAMAVLEVIRNNANVKKLNKDWKSYCLWFGFAKKRPYQHISECDSLILKLKIEMWARRCRQLGIEPKLKLAFRSY